ncbi:MAG: rlmD [Nevskia sp.]|nr:rlmD [Nevskia sp.]
MGRRARHKPLPSGEFTADIVDLAHDGRGVARRDGKVVFIHGALPGERVRYRLSRISRAADEGAVSAVELASPDRVEPLCAHFGVCGGCALQHLAPRAQIAFKQKQLLDALLRIGGVAPEVVAAPITGPVWGYRRRARLGVKQVPKKGGVLVGFREREAPLLAAIDSCVVLDDRVGQKLRALAQLFDRLSIAAEIPQVEVACADHAALVIRVMRAPSATDVEALSAFAAEQDFDLYLQTGSRAQIEPLGAVRPLHYSPDGGAAELEFGPMDFVQINTGVSQQMVRQALAWLAPQPGTAVLELFAGLGNFTLPLAALGAKVTAVEGEAALVAKGRQNLQRNGYDVNFVQADLFVPDAQAAWLREPFDQVLLDPPRTGAREVLPLVAMKRPQRIVYISCHPATLARDATELVKMHGYRLSRAGVLDMFPHTAHVESMALFERP